MGRLARLAAAILSGILPLAGAALGPSPAYAGTWADVTCTQPNGQPTATGNWASSTTGGLAINGCNPYAGGLIAQVNSAAALPSLAGAVWTYTAPAGSTIAGGTISLSLYAPLGLAYVATPGPNYDQADIVAACESGFPCGGQVNGELTAVVPITHPGGTALYAIAQCLPPGGGNCPAGGGGSYLDAQVNIYQAIIDLTSNATPAATGFGGALLTPGPVAGTQPLTFTATDPGGPGVYKVTVAVDGHPVYSATPDTNSGQCAAVGTDASGAAEFLSAQPCKTSVAVSVPVDTTMLADGPHDLSVTVTDAAGNSSPVLHQTIVAANRTTVSAALNSSPQAPTAGGAAGSSPAAVYAIILDPGTQALVGGAHRAFASSSLALSGTLRNSAGVPAPGVPVTLLAQNGRRRHAAADRARDERRHRALDPHRAPRPLAQAHDRSRHAGAGRVRAGRRDDQRDGHPRPLAARAGARRRAAAVHRQTRDQPDRHPAAADLHRGALGQPLADRRDHPRHAGPARTRSTTPARARRSDNATSSAPSRRRPASSPPPRRPTARQPSNDPPAEQAPRALHPRGARRAGAHRGPGERCVPRRDSPGRRGGRHVPRLRPATTGRRGSALPRRHRRQRQPGHNSRARRRNSPGRRQRRRRRPARARHDRRRDRRRQRPRRPPRRLAATQDRVRPLHRRPEPRHRAKLRVQRLRPTESASCTLPLAAGGPRVLAIDLPLSSVIQPSPDQTAAFADAVTKAQAQGIAILAAAGNQPGPIELPASEPGIFAVGAGDTTNGAICSISATTSLTFYAPGCALDTIDPLADTPLCCGNGTSQASAYAAGVLVALRSYDPALTPATATQLLLSTTTNGHLDVAAAFRAAGLGAIVDAGNAATPKPPTTTNVSPDPAASADLHITVRPPARPGAKRQAPDMACGSAPHHPAQPPNQARDCTSRSSSRAGGRSTS